MQRHTMIDRTAAPGHARGRGADYYRALKAEVATSLDKNDGQQLLQHAEAAWGAYMATGDGRFSQLSSYASSSARMVARQQAQ